MIRVSCTVFLCILLLPFSYADAQENDVSHEWNGMFSALYMDGDMSCISTKGEGGRFFHCDALTDYNSGDTYKMVFFLADEWNNGSVLYMFTGSILGMQAVSQGRLNGDQLDTYSLLSGTLHKESFKTSGSWEEFSFQNDNEIYALTIGGIYTDTELKGNVVLTSASVPISLEFSLVRGDVKEMEMKEIIIENTENAVKEDTEDSLASVSGRIHSLLRIIFYTLVLCIILAFGIIFYLTHYTDHFTKKEKSSPQDTLPPPQAKE
ncbi:hypothetical protein A3D11_04155 [Candidatus Peribacteria bacterium RIFCSPHIGHO2_02_FULL_49_16]|nr:MAG: hypothetical protein A2880_00245 [Candidatus Peribacteria bacterium RIFCSPHIGHO2_01_FULL_49_38]OGJ59191.1 MAG: hypothetical protein A3D11_04155 [Candidatus Peribacteria bacterium RIFCSPHIGHO2_02_FULL_49_16]